MDDFNEKLKQTLPSSKVNVKANTDILSQSKLDESVKRKLIENLPDKQSNTGQLKTELVIAVDMIYDISVNMDVSDGLTNGATCVVKHIEFKENNVRPAIYVQQGYRAAFSAVYHLERPNNTSHYEPIR